MIHRRSSLFLSVIKVIVISLILFFVIVAIAGPELPITVSGEFDRSGSLIEGASYLRSAKIVTMSSAAPLSAILPKINSLMRSGLPPPPFLYGTAWKEGRTEELVYLAVKSGFRGIDTACQPKHYYEPGVGNALERLFGEGHVKREDMFLQTKFTDFSGQDPSTVPYNKDAKLGDQVMESYRISLTNLKTEYLDSLVLHGPLDTHEDNMEVWRAFEVIHSLGGARYLGISNVYDLGILESLYSEAVVKPSFLQNRFYKQSGYDREIRAFCNDKGITYQGFWTLTANPRALQSDAVKSMAKKYGKTAAQIFFKFLTSQNIIVLTGTKDETHMIQDLESPSIGLTAGEIDAIDQLLR